jgi:hypothetical protein
VTAPFARAASLTAACVIALTLGGCSTPTEQAAPTAQTTTQGTTPSTTASASPTPTADASTTDAAALTAFVAAVQDQVPALEKSFGKTYRKITITADPPTTMVYTYTFGKKVDRSLAKSAFDKQAKSLQDVCDKQVFPSMKLAGVSAPKARYVFLNPDGSKIWSRTFAEAK